MKTNILLGFAALLCAVGSSFASLLVNPPHYVQIRYAGSQNFVCSTVTACDDIEPNLCRVRVNGILASVYDTKVNATTCSDLVFNSSLIIANITKPGTIVEATVE